MAISRVGTAQQSGSTNANITLTYPAGIQADDLILITVSCDGGGDAFAIPPGYQEVFRNNGNSDTATDGYHASGTFYRRADGTESGDFSFPGATASEQKGGTMQVFRGVDPDAIEHMWLPAPGDMPSDGENFPFGPITHSGGVRSEMLFYVASTGDAQTHDNAPTGFTGNVDASGGGIRCASSYRIGTNTDNQPAGVYVASDFDRFYTVLLAIPIYAEAPDTPSGFTAQPEGLSARLDWDDQPEADTWTVEAAPDAAGVPGTWFDLWPNITWRGGNHLGLSDGDVYWYRIYAENAGGQSTPTVSQKVTIDYSAGGGGGISLGNQNIDTGKLKLSGANVSSVQFASALVWPGGGAPVPNAPVLSSNLNISDIELSWSDEQLGAETTNYLVYRSAAAGGPWSLIAHLGNILEYTDAPGVGDWFYYVEALGVYGYSGASNTVNEEITIQPPAIPENISANWNNPDVELTWTAGAGGGPVDSYNVLRSTNSASGYVEIASDIIGEAYTDQTITIEDQYFYKIEAVGGGGTSAPSDFASVDVTFYRQDIQLVVSNNRNYDTLGRRTEFPSLSGGQSGDVVIALISTVTGSGGCNTWDGVDGWNLLYDSNAEGEGAIAWRPWDSAFNTSHQPSSNIGSTNRYKATGCVLLRGVDTSTIIVSPNTGSTGGAGTDAIPTGQVTGLSDDNWTHVSLMGGDGYQPDADNGPSGYPDDFGARTNNADSGGDRAACNHSVKLNLIGTASPPTSNYGYNQAAARGGNSHIVSMRGMP